MIESPHQWDVCPGCGKRLGQPDSARFDDEGEPVTTPAWHPECAQQQTRRAFEREPDGVVYMYDASDVGPLTSDD